jgi:hypothetical protein
MAICDYKDDPVLSLSARARYCDILIDARMKDHYQVAHSTSTVLTEYKNLTRNLRTSHVE